MADREPRAAGLHGHRPTARRRLASRRAGTPGHDRCRSGGGVPPEQRRVDGATRVAPERVGWRHPSHAAPPVRFGRHPSSGRDGEPRQHADRAGGSAPAGDRRAPRHRRRRWAAGASAPDREPPAREHRRHSRRGVRGLGRAGVAGLLGEPLRLAGAGPRRLEGGGLRLDPHRRHGAVFRPGPSDPHVAGGHSPSPCGPVAERQGCGTPDGCWSQGRSAWP